MSRTPVEVCDKCGNVFDPTACLANGHDLIPCPLCYLRIEHDKKIMNLQDKDFDLVRLVDSRKDRIAELEEKIKDLQDMIDDIAEELDEL